MEMDVVQQQQTATVALAGCPCQPWHCHGRYNTDTPRSVHVGVARTRTIATLQEGRQELAKGRGEEESMQERGMPLRLILGQQPLIFFSCIALHCIGGVHSLTL
jgi:hypothetical protein